MSAPWPTLAAACWRGEVARTAGQAERRQAGGDGAGADQHDLVAACARRGQRRRRGRRGDRRRGRPTLVVRDDEPTFTTMRRHEVVVLLWLLAGGPGLGLERPLRDELLAALLVGAPVVVVEALVLAAAAEHLGTGLDLRVEVEDDGVVVIADEHVVAGGGAQLEQPRPRHRAG